MDQDLEHMMTSHPYSALAVPDAIESELLWYFGHDEQGREKAARIRVRGWSAVGRRTVAGWLAAIDPYDAKTLEAAYHAADWPYGLQDRLEFLTGVVVRLASIGPGRPQDSQERKKYELRVARALYEERWPHDRRALRRHTAQAAEILATAVRAYRDTRGCAPSMVLSKRALLEPDEPSVEPKEPSVRKKTASAQPTQPSRDTKRPSVPRKTASVEPLHSSVDQIRPSGDKMVASSATRNARRRALRVNIEPTAPSSADIDANSVDSPAQTRTFEASSDAKPRHRTI